MVVRGGKYAREKFVIFMIYAGELYRDVNYFSVWAIKSPRAAILCEQLTR
jgi:hypothetical protein